MAIGGLCTQCYCDFVFVFISFYYEKETISGFKYVHKQVSVNNYIIVNLQGHIIQRETQCCR